MSQLDLLFDVKNHAGDWTPTAVAELLRLVHVEKLRNRAVSERMGRSMSSIESAVNRFCPRTPGAKLRSCMTCRREFFSAHVGNRICNRCKDSVSFSDFDSRYLECA